MQYVMQPTSGFVDDVMFPHNGADGAKSNAWRYVSLTSQCGSTGDEVWYVRLPCWRSHKHLQNCHTITETLRLANGMHLCFFMPAFHRTMNISELYLHGRNGSPFSKYSRPLWLSESPFHGKLGTGLVGSALDSHGVVQAMVQFFLSTVVTSKPKARARRIKLTSSIRHRRRNTNHRYGSNGQL